ncbi:uncharacterized protein NEMAJ01_1106 [Nematocida major]|uniref:uncharacterized protein n=1 Tax=Nematocida major TaxID=1912982 RepID=UPI00200738B9|nr:uncharacterized protein NEMAJ01_1106 [Nematocida major]KAH9386210.1 hypothetical protein NEMAJ01_1106 [Nematocida major]
MAESPIEIQAGCIKIQIDVEQLLDAYKLFAHAQTEMGSFLQEHGEYNVFSHILNNSMSICDQENAENTPRKKLATIMVKGYILHLIVENPNRCEYVHQFCSAITRGLIGEEAGDSGSSKKQERKDAIKAALSVDKTVPGKTLGKQIEQGMACFVKDFDELASASRANALKYVYFVQKYVELYEFYILLDRSSWLLDLVINMRALEEEAAGRALTGSFFSIDGIYCLLNQEPLSLREIARVLGGLESALLRGESIEQQVQSLSPENIDLIIGIRCSLSNILCERKIFFSTICLYDRFDTLGQPPRSIKICRLLKNTRHLFSRTVNLNLAYSFFDYTTDIIQLCKIICNDLEKKLEKVEAQISKLSFKRLQTPDPVNETILEFNKENRAEIQKAINKRINGRYKADAELALLCAQFENISKYLGLMKDYLELSPEQKKYLTYNTKQYAAILAARVHTEELLQNQHTEMFCYIAVAVYVFFVLFPTFATWFSSMGKKALQ